MYRLFAEVITIQTVLKCEMSDITMQDTLQFIIDNSIINLDDVRMSMEKSKRNAILKKHPYDIWIASDGRVKTYVEDETKAKKRRLIAKSSREELEDYIVKDYIKRHPVKKVNHSVEAVFKEWIAYALKEKDIEKNTADRYQNDYDRFILETKFSKIDIESVSNSDVIRFLKDTLNENHITRKTFSNLKTVLNGIFSYAMSEKNLNCISMSYTLKDYKVSDKKFKKNIVRDEEQVYSEKEISIISDYIIKNYRSTRELGILLALLTGLRAGELCSLKTSDQEKEMLYIQRTEIKYKDAGNKTIYSVREFPKSECSMNGIELSNSAMNVLSLIRKLNLKNGISSEFLFYEPEYGRLKSYFFSRALKKICNETGVRYRSMHKLRKTYASYLLANGVEEKIAQAQLRHKDSATTHKYYEFSIRNKEYKRDVLNKNDMLRESKIM